MERCYSNSSLPQGFYATAKPFLVKNICSRSEIKIYSPEDAFAMGDYDFKSRKRKPFTISQSVQNLCLKNSLVSPSTDEDSKHRLSHISSQDDLWTCILPDCNFLMADDLITECKETRKELSSPFPPVFAMVPSSHRTHDSHSILTYEEFIDRFNTLHDELHSLQTSTDQLNESKYQSLVSECQNLKGHASVLKLMTPDLTEDVNLRSTILKNKLHLLETRLFPNKVNEKDKIIKSLTLKMKEIRKWLQEMEGKLRKLKIDPSWDSQALKEIYGQEKILQREIEGRGKELTTIVRQCNAVEGATGAEAAKLRRAAVHLERSWHNIWIRSLEKQCLTEQRLLERQASENNHRESSDLDLDEGPLNKHRRLSLDRWTGVSTPPSMDRLRRDPLRPNDVIKSGLTIDIGIQGDDLIPVNDKCIMVGTTGIADLKAEYGDDFSNLDIIQDVGYSSESSTHLSSDDSNNDRFFKLKIYNYTANNNNNSPPAKFSSLKEELEDAEIDNRQQPSSLASSLGSSSGVASFNDSGICQWDSKSNNASRDKALDSNPLTKKLVENIVSNVFGDESADYLEAVLESCDVFGSSDIEKGSKCKERNALEDLQGTFSGIESDDSSENFHNRSSFTTSSQLFYKMISVESENDDGGEARATENTVANPEETTELQHTPTEITQSSLDSSHLSKTLIETTTPTKESPELNLDDFKSLKDMESFHTPPNDKQPLTRSATSSSLKRKRSSEPTVFVSETWPGGGRDQQCRVRSWLKRASYPVETTSRVRRCLFGNSTTPIKNSKHFDEDASSCDASGEYTSSDEGNAPSSSTYDDDEPRLRGEGSVETVLRSWSPLLLLPPPPLTSTPACLRKGQCSRDRARLKCGDMAWLVTKASSEGDLIGRGSIVDDGLDRSLMSIPTSIRSKKSTNDSSSLKLKHRMCSSLPNVTRHRSDSSADDLKTSQSEGKTSSRRLNDESFTSVVSHNQSSSSDLERRKKRRNRRKSSSSNRSSRSVLTSCDTNRSRARTLAGSVGGRRRHFSQKSDFLGDSDNDIQAVCGSPLLEEIKSPVEEINHTNLKEELQLALAETCRGSAALLSPTESDVVLTTLEVQSTVSDQVWDNYQDFPYLSEAYSEATVDEDAVRKLTEFGDDYGSAIGQPMRFLDAVDAGKLKTESQKSPSKKSTKAFATLVQSLDSDSDIEDLHHIIEEAENALHFARATTQRRQSGDFFSSAENAELLATCGTHLHCLQTICELIATDGNQSSFSSSDLKDLHDLIQDWQDLKRSIEMYNDSDDTITREYNQARQGINSLFKTITDLSAVSTNMVVKDCVSWEQLQENISKLQMVMGTLQETRELLLAVNLQVHRFMTEYGDVNEYKECSLKDDVTELYQKWDDVYEKNGDQLTKLEALSDKFNNFKEKLQSFRTKFYEIQCSLLNKNNDCDKSSISNEDLCRTLQAQLSELKRSADALRSGPIAGPLWKSINRDLKDSEQRIGKEIRALSASRNSNHSLVLDDPDDDFEASIQKLDKDNPRVSSSSSPHDAKTGGSSRFWRIIRVAVPVQLTLVLLFCLACYLEPNCCDRMNNFSLSFSPHLRYFGGPPPV